MTSGLRSSSSFSVLLSPNSRMGLSQSNNNNLSSLLNWIILFGQRHKIIKHNTIITVKHSKLKNLVENVVITHLDFLGGSFSIRRASE